MRKTVSRLASALLVVAATALTADAATYFVATTGSDANDGSQQMPFATIQKAADVAVAGDEIVVMPGTYAGAKFSTSGAPDLPIRIRGMEGAIVSAPGPANSNGDNIWIRDASWIIVEGFEIQNAPRAGIAIQGEPDAEVAGVVIDGNTVHDNTRWGIFTAYAFGVVIRNNVASFSALEHGIYVSNSADNPVITGNTCHNNLLAGIQINADPALDGDGIITNALVDSNIVFENGVGGAAGINLASIRFSLISNNLLYGNHASGIALWDDGAGQSFGSRNNRIFNNTIYQAVDGRFCISLVNGSRDNSIINNILLHPGPRGSIELDSSSETELVSDSNVVVEPFSVDEAFISGAAWVARGHDGASIGASPQMLFVDFANDDFSLHAESVAIDRGRPVSGVPFDLLGVPRPVGVSYDIGAYEFLDETVEENQNPVANAGADQRVLPASAVTLSGAASSDPDGDPLFFAWSQLAGPVVALENANTASPSFLAPGGLQQRFLSFELVVSDGRGGSSTDTVNVVVEPPPPAGAITVLRPVGGESWKVGKKKKIQFFATGDVTGTVVIELSRDNGATWESILEGVPVARGKKRWKVSGPVTTQALIRVRSTVDPRIVGVSPQAFEIR